jgi:hypothetical protein
MPAEHDSPELTRSSVPRDTKSEVLFAAALALALAGINYALNGNGAMHLQDEGFLWYGVVHTLQGQVPLRDFRSYDPGRYYWCAAWGVIFGDGFLALRLSCALFQAVGLTFGLLAARRAVSNRWMLVPIGLILAVWFFPPEKPFEAGIAMASVFAAVKLVEKPSAARHLAAGIAVGITGFFGRNLGLYSGLAFLALITFLRWKLGGWSRKTATEFGEPRSGRAGTGVDGGWAPGAKELGAWILGLLLGYAPMLFMIAVVPGFRASFIESVLFYARQTSLNAPLPVPWPWTIDLASTRLWPALSGIGLGLCFLLIPIFYLAAFVIAWRTRAADLGRRALLIAALFVGAIFAHHASVRSDVNHLAQCIHPLLLGLFAIPLVFESESVRTRASIAVAAGLFVLSALAIAPRQPIGHEIRARGTPNPFVPFDARGDTVWINRGKAQYLTALIAVIRQHVGPGEKLWIAPALLTLYPLLGRSSPVWDIYPAWRASSGEEARMLSEISSVQWVLWVDQPSDDDDALQLSNSHPAVWKSLMDDFERLPVPGLPSSILFLRRKHS